MTPLRARIVERLDHSGPTVSQTVARMERDGLLHVLGDRRLELTERSGSFDPTRGNQFGPCGLGVKLGKPSRALLLESDS